MYFTRTLASWINSQNALCWLMVLCAALQLSSTGQSSVLPVQPPAATIATRASDCATAKTNFCLGETVCAIATNFPGLNHLEWYDASNALQNSTTNIVLAITNSFAPGSSGIWTLKVVRSTGDLQGSTN